MANRNTNKAMTSREPGRGHARGERTAAIGKLVPTSESIRKVVRSKYFVPAVSTAGVGVLAAAAGIIFKDQFLRIAGGIDMDGILGVAGLQRRRSFLRTIAPGIGGMVVGMAAGSMLSLVVIPRLTERVLESEGPTLEMNNMRAHTPMEEPPSTVE